MAITIHTKVKISVEFYMAITTTIETTETVVLNGDLDRMI